MALDEATALKIIDECYSAEPVDRILERHGVTRCTFHKTLQTVPALETAYQRARSDRADIMADKVIQVVEEDGDPNRARNRMNALIWSAGKMNPKRYGDHIDVNVNATIDMKADIDSMRLRMRQVLDISHIATGCEPVVEISPIEDTLAKLLE